MAAHVRNDLSVVEVPKLSAPVRGRLEHQASRFVAIVAKLGGRYRRLAREDAWRPDPEDMRILEWCTRYLTAMLAEQRMRSQLVKGVEVMSEVDFERELDEIVRARVARMTDDEIAALRARAATVRAPAVDLTTEPAVAEESSAVADLSDRSTAASEHAPALSSDSSSQHSSGRPYIDDDSEYDE